MADQNERSSNASTVDIREFVIAREFDAPRDLVWRAWTEQDRLMQWFGPKGFSMRQSKNEFRPGGTFHYCLQTPDGSDMWGKWKYREIVPPEKLVFTNSFSDENGGLTRHPGSPGWPLEMLTTVTFEEQKGKTTVTVHWIPINATESERNTFEAGRESMKMGWTGTFDQLAGHLAKERSR